MVLNIQMHSIKGTIGLRIDGVENIELNNIYIYNIINYGNLGSNICGDNNIQYGYTSNNAHGIIINYGNGIFNNITIENINSN